MTTLKGIRFWVSFHFNFDIKCNYADIQGEKGALAAVPEDLGLIPSAYMVSYNHL